MTLVAMVVTMSLGAAPAADNPVGISRERAVTPAGSTSVGLWRPAAAPGSLAPGLEMMLAPDKLLHMSISANLAYGGTALARALGVSPRWALAIGIATAVGAGLLKEALDLRGGGQAEWADLGADLLGTTAGVAVSLIGGKF